MLLNLQENIFQNKYNSKNIHQYTDLLFFCFSCDYIDDHVGDNSHGDTFGNAVHKRHGDDCDETRDCFGHVVEIDLCNRCQHQITNYDQSRCSGKGRNCQEDRGKQKRKRKQYAGYQRSKTGTSAFCNSGGTFYKGGNGGSTAYSAYTCSDSVRKERSFDFRKLTVFIEHVGFGCNADQGSECIEHVNKQEGKHNNNEIQRKYD